MRLEHQQCRYCGDKITWWFKRPCNLDGTDHQCKPKIKHFTKEEIEKLNRDRGLIGKEPTHQPVKTNAGTTQR